MFRSVSLPTLLLAVVLSACSRSEPPAAPVRAVKLVTAGAGSINSQTEYAAEIRARTESRLGFQVPGKLQQRLVDVGQAVRVGQVLAVLDPQDYQSNAQAAAAQLVAAQSQRDLAQADLRRYESLRDQGFISSAELERRQVSLKSAEASLKAAQASASVQGNQAAYTRLQADADGVIVGADAEPGQVLAAGTPVVRLARNGPRDAVFTVPEDQVGAVKIGQAAQVKLWTQGGGQAQTLSGRVREVAASADPVTRTFAVKVALSEGSAALGSTASVRLSSATPVQNADTTLRLPMTAVWLQGKDNAVWVFDAAHSVVKARVVQLSRVDGNNAVIAAGLQPGEEVVVVGTHVLTDGQQVTRFQASAAAPAPAAAAGVQP